MKFRCLLKPDSTRELAAAVRAHNFLRVLVLLQLSELALGFGERCIVESGIPSGFPVSRMAHSCGSSEVQKFLSSCVNGSRYRCGLVKSLWLNSNK